MKPGGVGIIAFISLGIGGLAGFLGGEVYRDRLQAEVDRMARQPEARAREVLEGVVFDPESVRLRRVTEQNDGALCGELNAKNRMGGYVGFRRFIIGPEGNIEMASEAEETDRRLAGLVPRSSREQRFVDHWNQSCRVDQRKTPPA